MKRLPLALLLLGLVFALGAPLMGLVGTAPGMIGAFNTLGANGVSDPHMLSHQIGICLMSTTAGLIVSLAVGLPLIVIALVLHLATRKPRTPVAAP